MPVTDATGAAHPNAVYIVWALQLVLRNGQPPAGEFEIRGFVDDAALAAGKLPFEILGPDSFTAEDIAALQAAFSVAVVNRLALRPRFKAATVMS